MLPDAFIARHRAYINTHGHPASTAGVEHYRSFMRGGRSAGAHDSKPKPKPKPARVGMDAANARSFLEWYPEAARLKRVGGFAYDAEMVRRNGNVVAPSGREFPECLEDADPSVQAQVESTDREPVDETGHPAGRAPPWGKHDLPAQRSVTEPNPTLATDPPVSERQRKAMGAAASGHSNLGIPREVGERFLHEDAALGTVTHGQQGAEAGPEVWERTRGRDEQHLMRSKMRNYLTGV
jgi:hypothetical protein